MREPSEALVEASVALSVIVSTADSASVSSTTLIVARPTAPCREGDGVRRRERPVAGVHDGEVVPGGGAAADVEVDGLVSLKGDGLHEGEREGRFASFGDFARSHREVDLRRVASASVTVVVPVAPIVTPAGGVPKANSTVSGPSTRSSSLAAKETVCWVSPASKVTSVATS